MWTESALLEWNRCMFYSSFQNFIPLAEMQSMTIHFPNPIGWPSTTSQNANKCRIYYKFLFRNGSIHEHGWSHPFKINMYVKVMVAIKLTAGRLQETPDNSRRRQTEWNRTGTYLDASSHEFIPNPSDDWFCLFFCLHSPTLLPPAALGGDELGRMRIKLQLKRKEMCGECEWEVNRGVGFHSKYASRFSLVEQANSNGQ